MDNAPPATTSTNPLPPHEPQAGIGLIAVIGILAIVTIGLSLLTPAFVQILNQRHQDSEDQHLRLMANGIQTYLKHTKAFPPSLASLAPEYVPFSVAQLAINPRGFPRYYVIHPDMAGFTNSTGLSAGEMPNVRFLLISHLTQDAAPIITTPAEFETWWAMDERVIPNLHIHRSNVGHLFYSLGIAPTGNGASYLISTIPAIDSGGALLPAHNAFHIVGTTIGFDESPAYTFPEVQFALTTNTAYWFDPFCPPTKQWNPLDPICTGGMGTVRDEFSLIAYNGDDGVKNWKTDWLETGETDGPTSGKMQVVTDAQCAAGNCLQIGGGGGGASTSVIREVDLTGAVVATLTFSYRRTVGDNGGNIKVEVSNNGGGGWTTLQTYTMNASDATQVFQTFDITAFIAANTQVQFSRAGNVKRYLLADNIEIAWN